jgi:hypothetical protein
MKRTKKKYFAKLNNGSQKTNTIVQALQPTEKSGMWSQK